MTADTTAITLSPDIRSRLGGLRWRIRAYVWLEGLSLLVIWLGLMFWIGFAFDYLPVLLGYYLPSVLGLDEMTRLERVLLLAVVLGVGGWILYRWVLRRAFVRMADHSMAVLLERQFRDEHDSLMTAVEMSEAPTHATEFHPDMLRHTSQAAATELRRVRLRKAFRKGPLVRNVFGALLVAGSIVAFALLSSPTFATAAHRLYGLADNPYQRRAEIEVLCVEVSHTEWAATRATGVADNDDTGQQAAGGYEKRRVTRKKEFVKKVVQVARGSSPRLIVGARLDREVVPESCKIQYSTDEGSNELVLMERPPNSDREGYRRFFFRNRPFKQIRSNVRFDVLGGDHRLGGYRIQVVDNPTIVGAKLICERPAYTELLPQTIDFASGIRLPVGTRITIDAVTNKPLLAARIYDPATGRMTQLAGEQLASSGFRHVVDRLGEDLGLEISLTDGDNVVTDEPYRLSIAAVEDLPPEVRARLRGIGTAITADARLPAEGVIGDDYGVADARFELAWNDDPVPYRFPIKLARDGRVDAAVDLREARARDKDPLQVKPGEKIVVAIRAADKCDLGDGPNIGSSERYQLDVVTPEELMARLDAREIALRQRFEQILEEMKRTQGDLLRVRLGLTGEESDAGAEPGDEAGGDTAPAGDAAAEPEDEPLDDMTVRERAQTLRLLMVQRAILQTDKSAQEMAGVAANFDDVREELINNRVDTEERKMRLKDQISDPIKQIAGPMCEELARRLRSLEPDLEASEGPQKARDAVEQIDLVLLEMEKVLARMLDLESYNELVEIVRQLIKDQEGLLDDTKKERKKQILGGLLD